MARGAPFAIGHTLVGFDLFDQPSTLRKILPKLVRGVAVDAIDAAERRPALSGPARCRRAGCRAGRSIPGRHREGFAACQHRRWALGEDMRLAALVLDQHAVHLSAFAL